MTNYSVVGKCAECGRERRAPFQYNNYDSAFAMKEYMEGGESWCRHCGEKIAVQLVTILTDN